MKLKRCAVFLVGAIAVVMAAPMALAQQPASTGSEEIVVFGELRLEEQVRAFVESVSLPPSGQDQLARWDTHICVGVVGVGARHGQFIADRISARAANVGLHPRGPGCRANLIVFFAPNPDRLAGVLVEQYPDFLGYGGPGTRGHRALEDFTDSPRAVRWWHVAFDVRRAWAGGGGSRGPLTRAHRQDIDRIIIIVNAGRVSGMRLESVADYLAMVGLAQIDPDANAAPYDTILNLFSGRRPVATTLTPWDEAYLGGLYDMSRTANHSERQERQIGESMAERLRQ